MIQRRMSSPDSDFQFQPDVEALLYSAANQFDQPQHVAGASAGMDDKVVGVAFAHLSAADARARQAGLLDQGRRVEAARVLKNPSRSLERQGLARLPHNPRLAHPLDD